MITLADFMVCLLAGAAYRELRDVIFEIIKSVINKKSSDVFLNTTSNTFKSQEEEVNFFSGPNGLQVVVDENADPPVAVIHMFLNGQYQNWVEFNSKELKQLIHDLNNAAIKLKTAEEELGLTEHSDQPEHAIQPEHADQPEQIHQTEQGNSL